MLLRQILCELEMCLRQISWLGTDFGLDHKDD